MRIQNYFSTWNWKKISKQHNLQLYFSNKFYHSGHLKNTYPVSGYTIFTKYLWYTSNSNVITILWEQKMNTPFPVSTSLSNICLGLGIESITSNLILFLFPLYAFQFFSSPFRTNLKFEASRYSLPSPSPKSQFYDQNL